MADGRGRMADGGWRICGALTCAVVRFVCFTMPVWVGGRLTPCRSHWPALLGAQTTFIGQRYDANRSPYSGPMSLLAAPASGA